MADYQLTLTGAQIQAALNRANNLSSATGQSNTVIMSQKGVTDAVEAIVSVALDFQVNYDYKQSEIIRQNGQLYRAKADFTSGSTFNVANWDSCAIPVPDMISKALPFQAAHAYKQYEIIQNGNKLYAAIADFTSSSTFNLLDWQLIEDVNNVKISDFVSVITSTNKGITQTELLDKENILTAGTNIAIDRATPANPVLNVPNLDPITTPTTGVISPTQYNAKASKDGDFVTLVTASNKGVTQTEISSLIPDAPSDTKLYGRKDATWSEITASVAVSCAKPFQSNFAYEQYEIIQNDNKLYAAIADFTSSPAFNLSDWQLIEDVNNVKITDFVTNITSTNKGITQTELNEKENTLTEGTNIEIDRTTPIAPVLNVASLDNTTTGVISPVQYNALAKKDGDFVTAVTSSNKGVTEAELNVLGNGLKIIGSYWFGLTGLVTPFTVPLPTDPAQSYFDFTTFTPYTAKNDLTGWTAETPITTPTDDVEILITSAFWDITEAGLSGMAWFSPTQTPNWSYMPDRTGSVDNVTLDKRTSDGAFQIKEITQSDTTSTQTATFGGTILVDTQTVNTIGQITGTDTKTITLPEVHIVADEAAALAASAGNPKGIYAWEEV